MKKRNTVWRWWSKALGEKASKCDRESDRIAVIRTLIFASYLITNVFIISGVIRHWNDCELNHKTSSILSNYNDQDFLNF
jgi:hypothetical protein